MLRLSLALLPFAIQSQGCLDASSTTCVQSGGGGTNDCIDDALDFEGSTLHPFICAQCTTPDTACAATDTGDCEGSPRLCAICQDDLRCLSKVSECPDEVEGESEDCFDCPSSGCCVTKDRYSTKCTETNDWDNLFFCNNAQQCVPCEDAQTDLSNQNDDIDDGCSGSFPYCDVDAADPRDNRCVECETAADCTRQSAYTGFDVVCLSCTDGVCGQDADSTACDGTNSAGNDYICANDANPDHTADDGQCVPCIDDAGSEGTDTACDAELPYCVGSGDSRECKECEAAADCTRQSAYTGFDVVCLSCTDGVCGQDADGESCAPPENAAGNDYFCVNNDGGGDDGQCIACVNSEEDILAVDQGCSASLSHCLEGDCVECRNNEDCEGNCGVCTDNLCVPDDSVCGCGTCEAQAGSADYFPNHNHNCVGGAQDGCRICDCTELPCTPEPQSCDVASGRPLSCPCETVDECCGGAEGVVACQNGLCTACGCLDDGEENCALQCPFLQIGVCEYCEVNPAGNNCRPKDSKNCGKFCGGNEANLDPRDRDTNCGIHKACIAIGLDTDAYPIDKDCP